MSSRPGYVVRVQGHLDNQWAGWFGDWTWHHHPDGTTTLSSDDADQAQLHGLLATLRDLNAIIVSVSAQPPRLPTLPNAITTRRLTLRPAKPADADATWTYRHLPEVGEWLTEIPADPEAYRETFSQPERLSSTVIVERDGRVIGDFLLRIDDAWAQVEAPAELQARQAELGWVLDPSETGKGYATEAVDALIGECFTTLGVRRITANCFRGNEASRRLMERVGMRCEQHAVRESLHRSGRWLDTLTYALLADEYFSKRDGGSAANA